MRRCIGNCRPSAFLEIVSIMQQSGTVPFSLEVTLIIVIIEAIQGFHANGCIEPIDGGITCHLFNDLWTGDLVDVSLDDQILVGLLGGLDKVARKADDKQTDDWLRGHELRGHL